MFVRARAPGSGRGRQSGPRRATAERGSTLVEFALVVPLFALLLFAVVDFSIAYVGLISLRNGVANAAREAALDQYTYHGSAACTGGGDPETADLVCSVSHDIGHLLSAATSSLQIGICFVAPGASAQATCASESGPGESVDDQVLICAAAPVRSTTGVTAPFLDGRTMHASVRVLLEEPQPPGSPTTYSAYNAASPPVVYGSQTITGMNCP